MVPGNHTLKTQPISHFYASSARYCWMIPHGSTLTFSRTFSTKGTRVNDWREKHFGIPEAPKKVRDYGSDTEPRPVWPVIVLVLLIVSPLTAVGIAYYMGKFDPPPPEVVDRRVVQRETIVVRQPAPAPAKPQRPQATASEPRPTITPARANELQRLIESRERGLDLLSRDGAKARAAFEQADRNLSAARSLVAEMERRRPAPTNSSGQYEWSRAYNNATSALSTATAEFKRYKSQNDSFEQRTSKATSERDEAKETLATHDVVDLAPPP